MSKSNLAQINIAKAKTDLDSVLMREFVGNLEPVNALADNSPGFVWRLQDDSGDATSIQLFDDPLIIINMSVWQDIQSLKDFMFKTHHLEFLQRKDEWFNKLAEANHAMWFVQPGHIPSVEEGKQRLFHLRENGESEYAFTFRSKLGLA